MHNSMAFPLRATALLALLLASGLAPGACAESGPAVPGPARADLPPPVAGWLAQAQQDCPAGFHDGGAIVTAPLTGDGKPGYIADPHKLTCAGEPHLYGAGGPASIELFVTLPDGQVVHSSGVLALGYQIVEGEGGAPVIAFQTHNLADRAGSIDSYRWDGQGFTLISQRSMALPPED
jgi:hypothetical protein